MRTSSLNYAAVGAFVVAMLTAAIAAAAVLAGRSGPSDSYFIVLDNVADIRFGTVVRYEGYPIGQVERVVPLARGAGMRFRVEIDVERGWRFPDDSVARIGSSNLLANKTLDITGGASGAAIAVGGEIPGASPSDVFAAMSSLAGELGDVVAEIDRAIRRDLGPMAQSLAAIATVAEERAPAILGSLETTAAELEAAVGSLRVLLSAENVGSVGRTLRNVETASGRIAEIGGRLDRLIVRLDTLAAASEDDVADSLRNAAYILRSVAASIDSVNHDLEGTARNMNEFSRQIRQDPGALLDMPWRDGATYPAGVPR